MFLEQERFLNSFSVVIKVQNLKYVNLHDLQQCQPPLPDVCLSHRPFRTDSNDVCLSHRPKEIEYSNVCLSHRALKTDSKFK